MVIALDFTRRRRFAAVVLAAASVGTTAAWGGQHSGTQPARVELSDEAMGTTFSIVVYGPDRGALEAAARASLDEAQRLDRLLSNYISTSEWSAVNRTASHGPVVVSAELFG